MHIAIDDTYGPTTSTSSEYVTGNRRTNVGVVFPDKDINYIREQITTCLAHIKNEFSLDIREFHFAEIYNRKSPWDKLPDKANLAIFSFFAYIYTKYKWKVFVQTVDDITLRDHGIEKIKVKINQFNLEKLSDLSLFWLLTKIKIFYSNTSENLNVFIDEGLGKPSTIVGNEIFHDYPNNYQGIFQSSHQEPLLQLADFIAFIVNRSTHLYMKKNRTDLDNWFLQLFNNMDINSDDLLKVDFTGDYSDLKVVDFDTAHKNDRYGKRQ
jgi:hypothetical protein